jgi:hypothetical protein
MQSVASAATRTQIAHKLTAWMHIATSGRTPALCMHCLCADAGLERSVKAMAARARLQCCSARQQYLMPVNFDRLVGTIP